MVLYRDTKAVKPEIAHHFLASLVSDYPNVPGSKLLLRFNSLLESVIAYKAAIPTHNYMLIWQQTKKMFQTYNEFLNGLLGWIIVCLQASLSQKLTPTVFNQAYKKKLDEMNRIFPLFYLINNIAKPQVRNAIAHETIWLNRETDEVEMENRDKRTTMPPIEFAGLGYAGGNLCQSYLLAICVILIVESGNTEAIKELPEGYKKIFFRS